MSGVFNLTAGTLGLIGLGVLLVALLAYSAREARDADDYGEAARETADTASRAIGGAVGALSILVYALLGTIYQTGLSLAELVDMSIDIFVMAPEMFAGLGITVLAALGLEGVVPVSALGLVAFAVVVMTLAAVARRRGDPADGGVF